MQPTIQKILFLLTFLFFSLLQKRVFAEDPVTSWGTPIISYKTSIEQLIRESKNGERIGQLSALLKDQTLLSLVAEEKKLNQKCPLKSSQNKDLVDSMVKLYKSFGEGCRKKVSSVFEQLQSMGDEFKANTSGTDLQGAMSSAESSPTTQMLGQSAQAIDKIFATDDCASDLERPSVLNQAADIIQTSTQVALVTPNPVAVPYVVGGMAISSLLRMVDNFFKKKYNWDLTEERDLFLTLNCSFYHVRQEITKRGILDEYTEEARVNHQQLTSYAQKIDEAIKAVSTERDASIKQLQAAEKHLKTDKYDLIERYAALIIQLQQTQLGLLDPNDALNGNMEIATRLQIFFENRELLVDRFAEVLSIARSFNENMLINDKSLEKAFRYFKAREKAQDNINLALSLSFDINEFNRFVLAPMNIVFRQLSPSLDKVLSESSGQLGDLEVQWDEENAVKYSAVESKIRSWYDEKIKEAQTLKGLVVRKKAMYAALEKKEDFVSTDDGTANNINITQNYNRILGYIYSVQGASFLKYLTKRGAEDAKSFIGFVQDFENRYGETPSSGQTVKKSRRERFSKLFESNNGSLSRCQNEEYAFLVTNCPGDDESYDDEKLSLNDQIIDNIIHDESACSTALNLKLMWLELKSYSNAAYDFIATNNDIFHDNIFHGKKSKTLTRYLKVGDAKKVNFQRNSVIYARHFLEDKPLSADSIRSYLFKGYDDGRRKYRKTVGGQMVQLIDLHQQRDRVSDFYQQNNCRDILSMK